MSSVSSSPSRNEYLDYTKGVLIFLVVWGHLIQTQAYTSDAFYEDHVFKGIYLFHMPLFMAISGYLSFSSINRLRWYVVTGRRFVQLILPALLWALLFGGILLITHLLSGERSVPATVLDGGKQIFANVHSLWFLWALFAFTAMTSVMKAFRGDTILWMALVCIASLILPPVGKDYLFTFTLPFFCIGYQLAKLGIPGVLQRAWITWGTIILSIACYLAWQRDDYVYVSQMSLAGTGLRIILFRLATGVVVSIAVLKALFCFYSAGMRLLFVWTGRRSLEVYIIHMLILKVVPDFSPRPAPFIFSAFEAPILALALSVLCAALGQWQPLKNSSSKAKGASEKGRKPEAALPPS